ncbi:MAG: hypothetical protein GWN59_04825 [Calditrichae bacterium]|nr:hypothetical protein [Calditrichia bacterium]NIV72296.1 hypothetical protein [Calditrichia bacterium]
MKFSIHTNRNYPFDESRNVQLGIFIYAKQNEIAILQAAITEVLLEYMNENNQQEVSD